MRTAGGVQVRVGCSWPLGSRAMAGMLQVRTLGSGLCCASETGFRLLFCCFCLLSSPPFSILYTPQLTSSCHARKF